MLRLDWSKPSLLSRCVSIQSVSRCYHIWTISRTILVISRTSLAETWDQSDWDQSNWDQSDWLGCNSLTPVATTLLLPETAPVSLTSCFILKVSFFCFLPDCSHLSLLSLLSVNTVMFLSVYHHYYPVSLSLWVRPRCLSSCFCFDPGHFLVFCLSVLVPGFQSFSLWNKGPVFDLLSCLYLAPSTANIRKIPANS